MVPLVGIPMTAHRAEKKAIRLLLQVAPKLAVRI